MSASDVSPATEGPLAPERVFTRDQQAVTRRIAGETVIVPVRDDVADLDAIYTLNETGTFIWDRVDGQRTVAQLIEAVVTEFEVSREVATADVQRLLTSLRDEGLVHPAHG